MRNARHRYLFVALAGLTAGLLLAGALPASGALFHYLARAENGCGVGSAGQDGVGADRLAIDCP